MIQFLSEVTHNYLAELSIKKITFDQQKFNNKINFKIIIIIRSVHTWNKVGQGSGRRKLFSILNSYTIINLLSKL